MNNIISFKGIVGMMDVLGFKNKITSLNAINEYNTFCDIAKDIYKVFDQKTNGDFFDFLKQKGSYIFLYSDTLIFVKEYNPDDNVDASSNLGIVCSFAHRLIFMGIENNFALRGCISAGDVFIEQSINSVAGAAIVFAAKEHEIAKWIGCHFHSSCDEIIKSTPHDQRCSLKRIKMNVLMPTKDGVKTVNCIDLFDSFAKFIYQNKQNLLPGYFKNIITPQINDSENKVIVSIKKAIIDLFLKYRNDHPGFDEYPINTLKAFEIIE